MKRFAGWLFSAQLMAILISIFAISIAIATFIENDFGSALAKTIVYNAHWFEFLLFLGVINLTGRIFIKKLFVKEKFTIFLFHFSFIVILSGSALTRYVGSEGILSIREGQITDRMLTEKSYIQVMADAADHRFVKNFEVNFSSLSSNKFRKSFTYLGQTYHLKNKSYVSNAYETIEAAKAGIPLAEIIYADSAGRKRVIISQGERKLLNDIPFGFITGYIDSSEVSLFTAGDSIAFRAPYPVTFSSMDAGSLHFLEAGKLHTFIPGKLYTFNGQMIILNKYLQHGQKIAKAFPSSEAQTYDAATLELSSNDTKADVVLLGKKGYPGEQVKIKLNGVEFLISYGSIYKVLPFKLKLNDFIIERYPGSHSASSFESQVTLVDSSRNVLEKRRIYMNNVLNYLGYRLYQSSYDADEEGTILSVNQDLAGTVVSYCGYLLLASGLILSLFNRKSRFRSLVAENRDMKEVRKITSVILLFFLLNNLCTGQNTGKLNPIDERHAGIFGKMLVQDNNGRIEPVNTLSDEVLRKLIRKSSYKGMNADQVFLGMMTNPSVWQYEPVIRATHPEIKKILGSDRDFFSFSSFFRDNHYIIQDYVDEAFQKKPALRSKFDNEIIRLNERVNISYMVFSGDLLRLFPIPGDSTHTWYNHHDIQGKIHSKDSIFVQNIVFLYVEEVQKSIQTGDWTAPNDILKAISGFQTKYSEKFLPTSKKVETEVFLNRYDIFSEISKFYGLFGIILLILQFTGIFKTKLKLKVPVVLCLILICIVFGIHTIGLGLRWYVSGHAPWSNGYETLTYVAWATVLAGLIFSSKSSISASVTALLASLILFVAHLSWMDPQITNLPPVLKSYWLVIHVATVTASYGFLAMGALLAYMNMVLMILQTNENKGFLKIRLRHISNTIEMSLTIGLYLLTIGVFLGAVWANESWGRYWGWDPKETWALVTVLVYAFILHMRIMPGLAGNYAFNLASLLGFSSVIMTFFGVNYYLSGLHSYAKGDPLPIPDFVYYTLAVIVLTAIMAYYRNRAVNKLQV